MAQLTKMTLVGVAIAGLVGCTSTADVCTEASAHLSACTGKQPTAFSGTCDAQAADFARQVLSSDCGDLSATGGKADGQSNGVSMAVCISLGVPLFVTGAESGALCCFDYNCKGSLICRKHTCRAKGDVGAGCERRNHCQSGLACIADSCAPERQAGQSCKPNQCSRGLVCGPDATCTPPLANGATCLTDTQCREQCIGGTCAARSPKGGACDAGDKFDCQGFLDCINGTCQDQPGLGGVCDRADPFQCDMGQTCWDGKCEPRHAQGGACERMFDCEMGLFCIDSKCNPM